MSRLTGAALLRAVRGGILATVVLLMAAASAGALPTGGPVARLSAFLLDAGLTRVSAAPGRQFDNGDNSGAPPVTVTVNSTLDEVDASPGDGACASPAGRCTLRAAIMEANARGGRHTINLPAGTYMLTIAGTHETNAATGDLNIRGHVTIVGADAARTIIDANRIDRAFLVPYNGSADIRALTIRNGDATSSGSGGAILAQGTLALSYVRVEDSRSSFGGGGISSGGGLVVVESTIAGNQTPNGGGGGIAASSRASIVGSTISGNSAPTGAGVQLSTYDAELVNSTISGNTATGSGTSSGFGGGVYIDYDFGATHLTNVTIAGNRAPRGSGIYKGGGSVEVKNSIVATNTGSADCFRAGPITTRGNNIDGGTGCGFTAAADRQSTDPRIGPLAENGSNTKTHALLAGSPAIDTGAAAGCPQTDQRGVERMRDGNGDGTAACDIGAFEAPGTLGQRPPGDDGDNVPLPDNVVRPVPPTPRPVPTPVPAGQASLLGRACPGIGVLVVDTLNGFAAGDLIRINPGAPNQEEARIVSVGCAGRTLHLAGPLQFLHEPREPVRVVAQAPATPPEDDRRERDEARRRTEEQRQQAERTNRSGRDDVHSEGDVVAVDLGRQPPEVTIATRDGRQTVQLLCGSQCPTIAVGDYIEVDGTKEHEGLFRAESVTVTRR